MTKTPIQQYIDLLESKKGGNSNDIIIQAFIDEAKSLLPAERKFAEECWQDGQDSVQCYGGSISHDFSTFYQNNYEDGNNN